MTTDRPDHFSPVIPISTQALVVQLPNYLLRLLLKVQMPLLLLLPRLREALDQRYRIVMVVLLAMEQLVQEVLRNTVAVTPWNSYLSIPVLPLLVRDTR